MQGVVGCLVTISLQIYQGIFQWKNWKSVNIWQHYGHESVAAHLFAPTPAPRYIPARLPVRYGQATPAKSRSNKYLDCTVKDNVIGYKTNLTRDETLHADNAGYKYVNINAIKSSLIQYQCTTRCYRTESDRPHRRCHLAKNFVILFPIHGVTVT